MTGSTDATFKKRRGEIIQLYIVYHHSLILHVNVLNSSSFSCFFFRKTEHKRINVRDYRRGNQKGKYRETGNAEKIVLNGMYSIRSKFNRYIIYQHL